jgi:mRNA interferase MazF
MTLRRGDVVLIPFPFTDQSTRKRRPVLVLTALDEYQDFLAVAITSQPGHADAIALTDADFQEGALPKGHL